nr:uncharacterized protein LOC122592906 isoform X2 [Erigeron canadensis]
MASPVPAKSQPLHNFSLPHLKWKNHRSSRSRLAVESSSSPSPPHRSPSYVQRRPSPLHRQSQSESESEPPLEKTLTTDKTKRSNNNNNKICIRFRNSDVAPEVNQNDAAASLATEEDAELLPKTWNLRPRRPPPVNQKQSNINSSNNKIGSLPLPENRIIYNKNVNNKEGSEMKNNDQGNAVMCKKVKFSITLSRDEIEEDIYSLTGSKPARRPKKRPRTLQRQLDTLFPGLWLGSITADTYKVSEALPTK